MAIDRPQTLSWSRYSGVMPPLSAFMHVVCLRCGLIVDRKRKSTDLRTLTELFERVQCGNCCARSVLGEVIFSFDGGISFYEHAAVQSKVDVEPIVPTLPEPNWPPWKPVRFVSSARPYMQPTPELPTQTTSPQTSDVVVPVYVDWKDTALAWVGVAILGGIGVLMLLGLRMLIYVFAAALDP